MSKDPDDLYGDEPVAVIEIKVRRNGAGALLGASTTKSTPWQCLMQQKTVKQHNSRNRLQNGGLIIPANETLL